LVLYSRGSYWQRLRDSANAADLCQEALLAVFKSRHTYQPPRQFEPWLFAIFRNLLAAYFKRNREQANWYESLIEMPGIHPEDESIMATALSEGLGQLSAPQLEALQLTKLSGFSIAEAAVRAGTIIQMKVRVHRAHASLKRPILRSDIAAF
jgi:RNA polymerase sigma factor (sigma-70 family)